MPGTDLGGVRRSTRFWVGTVVLGIALVAALDVYAVRFAAAERTLYHADQLAYWSFSRGLAAAIVDAPLSAVAAIADSVAHAELNLLPAAPVSAAMVVLGPSRAAYLVSIFSIYGLAVVLTLCAALMAVRDRRQPQPPAPVLVGAAAAMLMLPSLWQPVFIGYLGLGGVALGLLILALYLRRQAGELTLKELLLIGFLVALLALFRRWYGIWSVGFCLVVAAESTWLAWRNRRLGRPAILAALRPAAAIGAGALATLLVLAAPLVLGRLGGGYTEEFAAYGVGGLGERLVAVVAEYGVVLLGIAAIAGFGLARRPAFRRVAGVICLQLAVVFVAMVGLQAHDPQHWYLYSAGLLVLVGTWIAVTLQSLAGDRRRRIVAGLLVGLGLLTTAAVFLPAAGPAADRFGPLVPRLRVRPKVRTDLEQIGQLLGRLDAEMRRRPGYIYVLGSSPRFSDQVLAFANLSLGTDHPSTAAILSSAHVDRRDGFPRLILEADYVVVGDPVQVHLGREQQQVVVVPAESFLEGRDIAGAFHRLPGQYDLEGGVEVSIFERVRRIRTDELDALSDRLRESYPDRPDIYEP